MRDNDIAILHDQFRTMGGAERVAVEIARELDAPIFVLRHDDGVGPDDVDIRELNGTWGQWLMHQHYMVQDAYQLFRWQHDDQLYTYDTLIETKTNPYWFVPNSDSQRVIRYVHSTPRNLYDQFHRRGGHWLNNGLMTVQRVLYQHTVPYGDTWLANSDIVARRMQMYFDKSADRVIYPPVDIHKAVPDAEPTGKGLLAVGRLAQNKRIDVLRKVAERIDVPVHVAGAGPEKDTLLDDAPENLVYHGYVSEPEKWRLYSQAGAFLMLAENEDFGITPIEAFASGTPVIGVAEGFTKHQVQQRKNGILVREANAAGIVAAIEHWQENGVEWSDAQLIKYAKQFGVERFRKSIRDVVVQTRKETAIEPGIDLPEGAQ